MFIYYSNHYSFAASDVCTVIHLFIFVDDFFLKIKHLTDFVKPQQLLKLDTSVASRDFSYIQSILSRCLILLLFTFTCTIDACSVCQCALYTCCLQQSMLLSFLSSLSVCQKKWTASTSPAPRCDRFFSLSVSLRAALLQLHTHTQTPHTLHHTDTQASSFCGPVTEDGKWRKERGVGSEEIDT